MTRLIIFLIAFTVLSCKKEETTNPQANEGLKVITSLQDLQTNIDQGVSMIFYHASWCHICQDQRPAIINVSEDSELNTVFFGEVEFDDYPNIIEAYDINGFPTMVIYKDGTEVDRFTGGGHTAPEFKTAIKAQL